MIRKKRISLAMIVLIMLFPLNAAAAGNWYYAAGNYVESAPIKPTTGLRFYADYSAITAYGSGAFTTVFDWNGSYQGKVSAVSMYPASPSSFPGYFLFKTDMNMLVTVQSNIMYYTSDGDKISGTYPMDSTSIYKCSISINANRNAFYVNGSFNSAYLEKVVRHEVGHVFLLKHPTNFYFSSVMHQGAPNGSIISGTVTGNDRDNMESKWGS